MRFEKAPSPAEPQLSEQPEPFAGILPEETATEEFPAAKEGREHRELPADRPSSKQRARLRFRMPVSLFAKAAWKTRGMEMGELGGQEHIDEIPEGRNVVVACTHISDLDMPTVAAVLSRYLNVAISDQSTHHKLDLANPMEHIGNNILVGEENFLPIDYKKTAEGKVPGRFNPDNYDLMVNEMDTKGKVIIVAASNPVEGSGLSQEERAKQSSKTGYAAAYLAGLADAIVLPVAVYTEENQVRVVAGKPFEVERVDELPQHGTEDTKESRRETFEKIRESSEAIFEEVTSLLPAEGLGQNPT